ICIRKGIFMRDAWNDFLNTDLKEQFICEINKALDEELKKSAKKRDYDKIEELTQMYTELMGTETQVEASMQRWLSEVKSKASPKRKITRKMRVVFATISVAVMLFVMNIITVSAFNMNVFSFIVHITNDDFSVNFPLSSSEVSDNDIIELSVSPDDPYGMIAECAKYGIYPETPHYLPEDYVLTLCRYVDMSSYKKRIRFTFTNQYNTQQSIMFSYDVYEDEESMSSAKFSNVEHHLSEIEINDKPAILAEEQKDKQFTVVYALDTLMISIFTLNVSWEEVDKVINSIN
ncbi:MAG: DUF4367 domain-containing protein, partial [Oscillospiraceae bacterium]|nr:DUF4367 domain-containing protein [Oscillospiraceae bacterium]